MKHKVLQIQKLNAETSVQLWYINIKILRSIDIFLFWGFFEAHAIDKKFTTPIFKNFLQPTVLNR